MVDEVEKSRDVYAAFCSGDDERGSWLWCNLGAKMPDIKQTFYAHVNNGSYEVTWNDSARMLVVTATKQVHMGCRMAGIGKIPAEWLIETHGDYNDIINWYLRSGEYQAVEYFVHDRI
jgi:hypothetical protein